jgi:cysteine desulfuration protein SufE
VEAGFRKRSCSNKKLDFDPIQSSRIKIQISAHPPVGIVTLGYILRVRRQIAVAHSQAMTIDEIIENFALLDEWDDRYRYVIELGRSLAPLDEQNRNNANKVQGCASQVWLSTAVQPNGQAGPLLSFIGDSDAHIVRGLIAILFAIYSGKHARDILATDAVALFERLGLKEHLTPQRSNGFRSMVERIKSDARNALATSTVP